VSDLAFDQAATLRKMAKRSTGNGSMQIFSITSGKGGVGKTSLICNIAARLGQLGKEVLLIDADLGLANVDIIMGITPRATLEQLFRGDKTLEDILLPGPPGVTILPSGSGVKELTHLSDTQIMELMTALDELDRHFDVLLIDTGAGIGKNVLDFNAAAQDVLVVTNPEPTSITDAYAIIKVLARDHGVRRFQLIVNSVQTPRQGVDVYRTITTVADKHMADIPGLNVEYLGHVLRDENVSRAVLERKLLVVGHPDSPASLCIADLVDRLLEEGGAHPPTGNMQFFWKRLLQQPSA
jgi:flagellar biosynthesis protein FlhG